MPVSDMHPEYEKNLDQWEKISDCLKGEDAVKARGVKYYPKSAGQAVQEQRAQNCEGASGPWTISKQMARFPELLAPAAMGFVGLASRLTWKIENLPARMEYIYEDAGHGLDVAGWQNKTIYAGLTKGRYILFPDMKPGRDSDGKPKINYFCAESMINWDTNSNEPLYAVFKESRPAANRADMFSHDRDDVYRVVKRDNGVIVQEIYTDGGKEDAASIIDAYTPTYTEMPIVVGGATENTWSVQRPPLISIAECALSAYRLSASFRWALRQMADPILLAKGFTPDEIKIIGAGTILEKEETEASIEYVEMTGSGLLMLKDEILMEIITGKEAGHALKEKSGVEASGAIRQHAQSKNATLKSVDGCAAKNFEDALNIMARMQDLPDNIKVVSALDYSDNDIDAVAMTAISNVVEKGQLPARAVPEYAMQNGMFENSSIEEVLQEIEEERLAREASEAGADRLFDDGDA